jgi:MFS family permease
MEQGVRKEPGVARTAVSAGATPTPRRALIALCITEITSWGVLYYAFPVLVSHLTRATGWPAALAMAAFSVGLVTAALTGVPVGRLLDRYGPRPVMTAGSVVGVAAVLAVAAAPSLPWFFAAWVLAGVAESALLYTPAFSALTRWYGPRRVRALTTLSLVAGLSSTVFAPLTAALIVRLDWRMTYVVLALFLGVVTIPLHAACLTPPWPAETSRRHPGRIPTYVRGVVLERAFAFLVLATTLAALGMYAANLNLVPLLTSRGASTTLAASALGLSGAGQVLGRLGYATLAGRTTPRSRMMAVLAAGAGMILLLGVLAGPTVLLIGVATAAGCVRGIFTLVQATAVSDRWGTRHFASLNGFFSAPATIAMAVAPAGGALFADWLGGYAAAFSLLAGLVLAGAAAYAFTQVMPGRE